MEKVFSQGSRNLEWSVKVPRLLRLLSAVSLILLIFLFPPFPASADQISWQTLYSENFEDGTADCWGLDTRWQVEQDDSNYVLSGTGHTTSSLLSGANWTDYRFSLKVKLISEGGLPARDSATAGMSDLE